jgi:energy-converting hydrogenase Eha subunit A
MVFVYSFYMLIKLNGIRISFDRQVFAVAGAVAAVCSVFLGIFFPRKNETINKEIENTKWAAFCVAIAAFALYARDDVGFLVDRDRRIAFWLFLAVDVIIMVTGFYTLKYALKPESNESIEIKTPFFSKHVPTMYMSSVLLYVASTWVMNQPIFTKKKPLHLAIISAFSFSCWLLFFSRVDEYNHKVKCEEKSIIEEYQEDAQNIISAVVIIVVLLFAIVNGLKTLQTPT